MKFRDIKQELHLFFLEFLFALMTTDSKEGGRMSLLPLALLITLHARKTLSEKKMWDKQTKRILPPSYIFCPNFDLWLTSRLSKK